MKNPRVILAIASILFFATSEGAVKKHVTWKNGHDDWEKPQQINSIRSWFDKLTDFFGGGSSGKTEAVSPGVALLQLLNEKPQLFAEVCQAFIAADTIENTIVSEEAQKWFTEKKVTKDAIGTMFTLVKKIIETYNATLTAQQKKCQDCCLNCQKCCKTTWEAIGPIITSIIPIIIQAAKNKSEQSSRQVTVQSKKSKAAKTLSNLIDDILAQDEVTKDMLELPDIPGNRDPLVILNFLSQQ